MAKQPPYTPQAATNVLIDIGIETREHIDPLKAQKLLFISHGRYLCDYGKPLINESFRAWKWGPVVASLYHDLKWFGRRPISRPIFAPGFRVPVVDPGDQVTLELLRRVWDHFSRVPASTLSALTHIRSSPWSTVREQEGVKPTDNSDLEIPNPLISLFFRDNFRFIGDDK